MTSVLSAMLLFLLTWPVLAQTNVQSNKLNEKAYSNSVLGFRYTPPNGMRDTTIFSTQAMRERATALHQRDTLGLVLSMSSGEDDTASGWHSLSLETYPRAALGSLDEVAAETRMSAWVGGRRSLDSPPRLVVMAGQTFALSGFEKQEGTVTKYATIYTTIRRGKILSFAFSANSKEQLKEFTESMKSLLFQ
jgi:hypothetical protein